MHTNLTTGANLINENGIGVSPEPAVGQLSDAERRKESIRASKRRYEQSEKGKARKRTANARMRRLYPDLIVVGNVVTTAVRAGRMVRQPCEVCGEPKTHAHHDDYSKPLDVRWLCPKHHREHHRNSKKLQEVCL
jgi:hypothetical protein